MKFITICYIDGDPTVYDGLVSEEDRAKTEALFPGKEVRWEVRRID